VAAIALDLSTADQELPAGKDITFRGVIKWRQNDVGGAINAKPLGDGTAGLIDITNDDVTGFLYHLHTGTNSTASAACIGIGVDAGSGTGLIVRNKAQGTGISLANNGTANGAAGAGFGFTGTQKATTAFMTLTQSNNYTDATITGTTTIALPTAGLAVGDVGIGITGTGIPGGTTLSAVNVGASTATLSQPCTNGTNVSVTLSRTAARGPLLSLVADATAVAGQQMFSLSNSTGAIGIVSADTGLLRWYKTAVFDGAVTASLGDVTVGSSSLAAGAAVKISTAAGQTKDVQFYNAGGLRWAIRCNADAEAGSDAGSNFQFMSRTDAGGFKAFAMTIVRATSQVQFASSIKVGAFATGSRPSASVAGIGAEIYDSTLSKPIYSDGTIWRDAIGVAA
jgi:hypothetical protein